MSSRGKRVFFINPVKPDGFPGGRIHMGFSLLGEILASNGHKVKIMDYNFFKELDYEIRVPDIEEVIHEFEPHVVGISVFTYLYNECQALIERISHCSNVPIILGGPHFAVFPEDFSDDRRISYIVRGEAEKVILNLVETAKCEQRPVLVDCPLPSVEEIPRINLDIAYGSQHLKTYQIQLSRGCPFNCSFCSVSLTGGRHVRARNLETCLNQIVEAKNCYPNIEIVSITDDCPSFDKERFKTFLRMFREANTGCRLVIDNIRADLIDEEMIQLYVAAGGQNICLGVESGHPEVFKLIHKGENLESIIKAAKLVHKYGLTLGLCFVIGLPEDNLKRHSYSIRLAKALKPAYIFWNMCVPWPGTEVHQWHQTHGEIGDVRDFSTLIDPRIGFIDPVASSIDFPKEDRIKAWLMANMETPNYSKEMSAIPKLVSLALKYKLYRSLTIYLTRDFLPRLMGIIFFEKNPLWPIIRRGLVRIGVLSTARGIPSDD